MFPENAPRPIPTTSPTAPREVRCNDLSYAGLTRVSINLEKSLAKKMDGRVEPGPDDFTFPNATQQKTRRCRRLSLLHQHREKLMRGFQGGLFLTGDGALHGRLHLLEGADLDLPHAFARYAEFAREVFQRHRIFRQPPRLEDAAFPGVEHADGAVQRLPAVIELLVLGHDGFLVGRVIDQPVLPFAGFAVVADRRVERRFAAETAVHVDNVLGRDAEALGNQLHLVGVHITLVQRGDLALRLAQVEEQLLLVRGGAHLYERPRTQDVLLY